MYCQCISFFIYILISEHVYFTFLQRKFVSLLTTMKLLSSTMCEYCSIIERFSEGTIVFVFLWVLATANNELSPRDFHWMRFWELWSWQLLQQMYSSWKMDLTDFKSVGINFIKKQFRLLKTQFWFWSVYCKWPLLISIQSGPLFTYRCNRTTFFSWYQTILSEANTEEEHREQLSETTSAIIHEGGDILTCKIVSCDVCTGSTYVKTLKKRLVWSTSFYFQKIRTLAVSTESVAWFPRFFFSISFW